MAQAKKIRKRITIHANKCIGCRACELACAAFHAKPRYSSINPARSRIQIIKDPLKDIYLPVYAGEYTATECTSRNKYILDGKEYSNCDFCRASCPSRDLFKEPDSGLPLKCDMCEDTPPLKLPKCVEWCPKGALIYEEVAEDVQELAPPLGAVETGVESMIEKYGLQKVLETVAKLARP